MDKDTLSWLKLLFVGFVVFLITSSAHSQETPWTQLNDQVIGFLNAGRTSDAIAQAEQELKLAETRSGSNHLEVATAASQLALIYQTQDRFEEAIALYKRALTIRETEGASEIRTV